MDIQLRYAAFKDLYDKLESYSRIAHIKNYTDLTSKKYKERIKSLINTVQYEITELESQASIAKIDLNNCNLTFGDLIQCRIHEPDVNKLFTKIEKISLDVFIASNAVAAEHIYNIEVEKCIIPEWILPTSTFLILPEEVRECLRDDIKIIQDFFESNTGDDINIDNLFINELMTTDRIHETLKSWQSVTNIKIQNRYPILEQALYAHKEGKFFLSVSTLIPQVEGIIRDTIESSGKEVDFGKMTDAEIHNAIKSLKEVWKNKNNDTRLLNILDNIIEMVSRLYIDDREKSSHDGLYRHGICHGRLTNFCTAKNSLKLILILDRFICLYDDNLCFDVSE
ncbi:MAG: hypothetical protein V7K18_08775 [Nostoc sp.]|uniref:hypothetical protein n=1 Tax=Nostoc sp. TaxID=1180 RepID=UPI002FF7E2EC